MAKVAFTAKYEILPEEKESFFNVVREIKNLMKMEGLESYNLYKLNSKGENYIEVSIYESEEAWEKSDEYEDERLDILNNKLSDLIVSKSTRYEKLTEIEF